MKTWIKRSLIGLAVAGTLFGGLAAFAHNSYRSHGWQAMSAEDAAEMKTKVVDRVGKQLDLDAAQKAKLGLLADKMREQRNALVGSTTNPRAEIQSLMAGPVFDRNKATSLIQDKVGAVNSKSPEVVAAMANFYDSLKPEQQAKVREFMAKGGRGKHGGRHGGERGVDCERRGDGGRHGHGGQGG
ncbi:MAG: Spy/CpxP family protein refolding chaperone [Rubrivivax sp.]|nr:Spy/CpxP family protein refolding chaperone [Rubrivivax sp.]